MNEIKFYGRGGQGVVMASQILGTAFFKAGKFPQCYSLFGGERRGAPVVSFLRVDNEKILLKCNIKSPNELLYFDKTLVNAEEIRTIMRPGGHILISTEPGTEDFSTINEYRLALIHAGVLAKRAGLGHVTNTAILGAYCRFTGHFSLDFLLSAIEEMVPSKVEENKDAARQGYDEVSIWNGKG